MAANARPRPRRVDMFMLIDNARRSYQDAYSRWLDTPVGTIEHGIAQKDLEIYTSVAKHLGLHPLFIERWQEIVEVRHDQ